MPMHDFHCRPCNVVFEDYSTYDNARQCVTPVECPQCGGECQIVWLKAPGVAGDENLTAEEKVAAALKIGFGQDGKLTVPKTRADLRRIRQTYGDFKVGERELMSAETPQRVDTRTAAEKEADRAATIDAIRERRRAAKNDEIPRATPSPEVIEAQKSTPINSKNILAGKRVS
jgi:hypothetical protein